MAIWPLWMASHDVKSYLQELLVPSSVLAPSSDASQEPLVAFLLLVAMPASSVLAPSSDARSP